MTYAESILYFLISLIGMLITLVVPLPLKDEYRLFIITAVIFIVLLIVLTKFDNKLKDIEERVGELDKRFKTYKELEDIRLDLRELKREVFK